MLGALFARQNTGRGEDVPKETWMWLAAGLGFGAVNSGELLAACPGGAEEVQAALGSEALDEILTQKQAEKLATTRPEDYALMLAHAEAQGIQALPYDDRMFPGMLRNISNPPLLLFVKGDLTLLNGQLSVGMVGARRPSGYGVEAMRIIGRGVALGGAIIVSGLAAGLDSEAHKAALAVNGPTIACIAFGHENCYPAQNKKLMEVIERYGAVVSEYPPGQKPEKPFFLHRNRLIAGLSHALVVAEARKHSGTMSTVNFATEYGRDVFAVPGSIFSELSGGTNAMIRDGAFLAASAADVLSVYGIELPEEDIAKAAEAQAQEGRPAMASATPPWHTQGEGEARRPPEGGPLLALDSSPAQVKAGEQTLLEALQSQLAPGDKAGDGGERVSRNAAIDAFRRLQREMPPTSDAALDARNRALDEMAAAVSDEVDFRHNAPKPQGERSKRRLEWERKLAEEPEVEEKIKPFRWDSVEHLTKAEVTKREREVAAKREAAPQRMPARPVYPVSSVQAVDRLAPVGAVPPVMRPMPQSRVIPAQPAVAAGAPAAARPVQHVPQAAAAPRQAVTAGGAKTPKNSAAPKGESRGFLGSFRKEDDLAGKLRTLQKPAAEERRASTFAGQPKHQEAGVYSPQSSHSPPAVAQKEVKPYLPPVLVQEGTAPKLAPPPPEAPPLSSQFQFPEEERVEEELLDVLSDAAKLAYEQLGVNPVSLAQIAKRSGLSPGEAMAALTELELAGLSRQMPGRQFVIMQ